MQITATRRTPNFSRTPYFVSAEDLVAPDLLLHAEILADVAHDFGKVRGEIPGGRVALSNHDDRLRIPLQAFDQDGR